MYVSSPFLTKLFLLQNIECEVIQKKFDAGLVFLFLFAEYQQEQQAMMNQSSLSSIA